MAATRDHTLFSDEPSLVSVLRKRAELRPERLAFAYLEGGVIEGPRMTYAELHGRALAIALELRKHARPGDRALLLFAPGLEYIASFFGCLYAGVIAVPAYPPDPSRLKRMLFRLDALMRDCSPRVILTTSDISWKLRLMTLRSPRLALSRWISSDRIPAAPAGASEGRPEGALRDPRRDEIAFLQYTSGSTGDPKGVMVTHGNLMHNMQVLRQSGSCEDTDRVVSWLPLYHDMGLIGQVLHGVYTGLPTWVMSPLDFLRRPFNWLKAISDRRISQSGGPSFAFELCVSKITEEQMRQLDLSCWDVAFCGAEPIRSSTVRRFTEKFAACGFDPKTFFPCYGLAEATLMVTSSQRGWGAQLEGERVGAGRLHMPDGLLKIVHPETLSEVEPGEVGEIWLQSPSVCAGYWNRPELTKEVFGARISGKSGGGDEGEFLRTGDLGLLSGGELQVTGRLKDLIIIHGKNHYPGDIEHTVERCHPAVRPGCLAAFSVDGASGESLVVVTEVKKAHAEGRGSAALHAIEDAVRKAVQKEHGLRAHEIVLIRSGTIPKTTSGKIQRRETRHQYVSGRLHRLAKARKAPQAALAKADKGASSDALKFVAKAFADAIQVDASGLDPGRELASYGADSIAMLELHGKICERYGPVVELDELFKAPRLADVAEMVSARAERKSPAALTPRLGLQPLSAGQRSLWFLRALNPGSTAYHVAIGLKLRGAIDVTRMRRALGEALERHPALRTRFVEKDSIPFQWVQSSPEVELPIHSMRGCSDAELGSRIRAECRRPFDLEREGPFRAFWIERADGEADLILVVHHIAFDGASGAVLARDLIRSYEALGQGRHAGLPAPPARSYLDFVAQREEWLASPQGEASLRYWLAKLSGEIPLLDLPTDRPRPARRSERGSTHRFRLEPGAARELRDLARSSRATLYSVLLSAYLVWLKRLSGQQDLVIGTPMLGRDLLGYDGVVGYFANMRTVRESVPDSLPFARLLERVDAGTKSDLAHQGYPFPLLVEKLNPKRDPGRSPVFDVVFAFQSLSRAVNGMEAASGTRFVPFAIDQQEGAFDLELEAVDGGDSIECALKYATDLFDGATIEAWAECLKELLRGLPHHASREVSLLPFLPASQRERLVAGLNPTARDYDLSVCLHELFERQADRDPAALAVAFGPDRLNYAELEARANQLAHALREEGIGPDHLVGVALERSIEMVVALYGILKAGGAYVPIDPSYPDNRARAIFSQLGSRIVLTSAALSDRARAWGAEAWALDSGSIREAMEKQSISRPERSADPSRLAYVIFTSGSTGQPKGVMIPHRGIVNRILWMQEEYGLQPGERVLQKTPYSFDVSVWEFFWPLAFGASLHVPPPGLHKDSEALAEHVRRESIHVVHFVPSMLELFLEERGAASCVSLKKVLCSGEALQAHHVRRFFERLPWCELHNLYGPTEASVDVSSWRCEPRDGRAHSVPIGRPIANIRLHILDSLMRPVPRGAVGELCIAGVGLARGYLRRVDLTHERFVPDPFVPDLSARIYRTGDLARYRADGAIEYLGRMDEQVKLRGFRIELGEVEQKTLDVPGVRSAAATIRDGELAVYVVAQPGASVDAAVVRERLGAELPDFMVPRHVVALAELPLSANGKVDRKRLPAAPERASQAPRAALMGELEERIAGIWRELLGIRDVGAEDDFFALGGNSLLCIRAVNEMRASLGARVRIQDFYRGPSIRALARRIQEEPHDSADPDLAREARFERAIDFSAPVRSQDPAGDTLLTGATGFLGAYLLRDLLERTPRRVVCLVRAPDDRVAMERIQGNLLRYGIWKELYADRISALPGDLSRPHLGLDASTYAALAEKVTAVIHNAARVDFVQPYERLKAENVGGTEEVIRFCAHLRRKPLHYVSTVSVFASPDYGAGSSVNEAIAPLPSHLMGGYAQSKWVAESLALEAARGGLRVAIYRPGSITGDSVTGRGNPDDLFARLLKGAIQLGSVPRLDRWMDLTPVDFASRAMIGLFAAADLGEAPSVFHIVNPEPIAQPALFAMIRERGHALEEADFGSWVELLRASPGNALGPLLPLFTEPCAGSGQSQAELSQALPRIACGRTSLALRGLGIECPRADSKLIATYLARMGIESKPSSDP
jgi:amino acid adenylation domain-containing protein/thioester reductase-like protein